MLQLYTDSDTDFTPEMCKEFGYKLISMPYCIDGKEIYPYVDFETFDPHTFYDQLRGGTLPTTSAISKLDYISYFEPEFEAGNDILYVHFSAAMTMTFQMMEEAVTELLAKYPDRKFYQIDTKAITLGSANLVYAIGDLYKQGYSAEELVKWAETEVDHFAIYFLADDLKFFKRSGRVSGLAATMGSMIGVRPLIHMNSEGQMVSIGKERGREKGLERLLSYVDELGDHVTDYRILVGNTDAPELVEEVVKRLRERFGEDARILVIPTNPTAGSHCGPNCVGIGFHAIHR